MRWTFHGFYTFFHLQLITGFSPTRFSIFCIQKLQQKYGIHKQIGYRNSRKILFNNLYKTIIYGNNQNNKIKEINCEHVWCQKYFQSKEPMKSDLHILYLSNAKLNSHRNDYKFSTIYTDYIVMDTKGNKIENDSFQDNFVKKNNKKKIFEPSSDSKGKIVRCLAYYYVMYDKNNSIENLIDIKDLLQWNRKYLPKKDEIIRNEIINNHQENINPFIRYPILIEFIFNKKFNLFSIIYLGLYTFYTLCISKLYTLINMIKNLVYKHGK
jgi:endonuclease I